MTTETKTKWRRLRPGIYRFGAKGAVVRTTWRETNRAFTMNRASYYTRRKVTGWQAYVGARTAGRAGRLSDAKALVEEALGVGE